MPIAVPALALRFCRAALAAVRDAPTTKRPAVMALMALCMAACAPVFSSKEENQNDRVTVKADPPVQLAMEDKGRGEPILLLHGLGTSAYTWRHITPALAKTHRVITLDLKGFGASEKPDDGKYSVFDQAALIKTFIEQQNLRNLTVVGHSFGGGVALALALDMAGDKNTRLKSLVLMDTIAYKQPLPIFFKILITPGIGELGMTLVPPEVQITEALNIAYHDDKKIPPESISAYAQPLYSLEAKMALRKTVEQLIPPDVESFTVRYKSLNIPTLVVWCEHDEIIPLSDGRRLARDIKTARLQIIKDCGHLPQEERPDDTLAALQGFLKR